MHSLSQQQTSSVPIIQNKFSRGTSLQGYPGSAVPLPIQAPQPAAGAPIRRAFPPPGHTAHATLRRQHGKTGTTVSQPFTADWPAGLNSHRDARA